MFLNHIFIHENLAKISRALKAENGTSTDINLKYINTKYYMKNTDARKFC